MNKMRRVLQIVLHGEPSDEVQEKRVRLEEELHKRAQETRKHFEDRHRPWD